MTVIVDVCLAAAGERLEAGRGGDTAEEEPLPLSASHEGPSLAEWWEGGCECGAGVTLDRGVVVVVVVVAGKS